jgi:integrase
MGHATIQITYDRYGHLLDDAARRAEKQVAASWLPRRPQADTLRAVE